MNSCIYEGWVRHRRQVPQSNAFRYRLFMMFLDLDELPTLFDPYLLWSGTKRNVAWFRRKDHVGHQNEPLPNAVRELVKDHTGQALQGPIRLLTHLSYFGYRFNPVSFYYCYDRHGEEVETVVAEVNNTPWGEQHHYVLPKSSKGLKRTRFSFDKAFHVSPFMRMNQLYNWRLTEPGRKLAVHMENMETGEKVFDATMCLSRTAIDSRSLFRVLVQYPMMTTRVVAAIHWQAIKLWLKGCTHYPHPGSASVTNSRGVQ